MQGPPCRLAETVRAAVTERPKARIMSKQEREKERKNNVGGLEPPRPAILEGGWINAADRRRRESKLKFSLRMLRK